MNNNGYVTYTSGFNLKFGKDITRKEFIELCALISLKLNDYYKIEHTVKILPERIIEGGIVFTGEDYDNSSREWYKTMRFYLRADEAAGNRKNYISRHLYYKWPWIKGDVVEEWGNNDQILIPKDTIGGTGLKAFRGAPLWTKEEVNIFKECFEKYGATCKKMPRSLKSYAPELAGKIWYQN